MSWSTADIGIWRPAVPTGEARAMTISASTTAADRTRGLLDGDLLLPGDAGYDDARTVWNALVDRRPTMIVRCASARDVVTSGRPAPARDLGIGVRRRGHSPLWLAR